MDYHDSAISGIAFGLSFWVGLQGEKNNSELAGMRTRTLKAILGVMAGIW